MSVAFFLSSLPKIAVFLQFFLLQSIDLAPLDFLLGNAILTDVSADCKGRSSEKDGKTVPLMGYILPCEKKIIQNGNFFSGKSDIFNVDRR